MKVLSFLVLVGVATTLNAGTATVRTGVNVDGETFKRGEVISFEVIDPTLNKAIVKRGHRVFKVPLQYLEVHGDEGVSSVAKRNAEWAIMFQDTATPDQKRKYRNDLDSYGSRLYAAHQARAKKAADQYHQLTGKRVTFSDDPDEFLEQLENLEVNLGKMVAERQAEHRRALAREKVERDAIEAEEFRYQQEQQRREAKMRELERKVRELEGIEYGRRLRGY